MKIVVNTELQSLAEWYKFAEKPYHMSDFQIGRQVNPKGLLANFSENLLLYDKVYIVTRSFEEVITIKDWMGGHNLESLLRDDVIRFVQTPFAWGYIQKWKREKGFFKSSGIVNISLAKQQLVSSPFLSTKIEDPKNMFGGWSSLDIEEAVSYTLTRFHSFNPKKVGKFSRLVARQSSQLRSESFRKFIQEQSESDLKDVSTRSRLGIPDDMDIENIPDKSIQIRQILRVVTANQELAIMSHLPEADLMAEEFYLEALKKPITNYLASLKNHKSVNELFSIENQYIPEKLGQTINLPEIIKIRNSREGIDFRVWFHNHANAGEDIKKAYVDLLKRDVPMVYRVIGQTIPAVLSLLSSKIIKQPLVDQIVGISSSVATDVLVNDLVKKYLLPNPPKVLFTKLKKNLH